MLFGFYSVPPLLFNPVASGCSLYVSGRAEEHGVRLGTCETLCLTVHSFLCHFCRSIKIYALAFILWYGKETQCWRPSRRVGWRRVQTGGSEPALEQEGLDVVALTVSGFRACRSHSKRLCLWCESCQGVSSITCGLWLFCYLDRDS